MITENLRYRKMQRKIAKPEINLDEQLYKIIAKNKFIVQSKRWNRNTKY